MDEGFTFGNLTSDDRNIISTERSAFAAMNSAFRSKPRSTQSENSNSTENQRFEKGIKQQEINSIANEKLLIVPECNSTNRSNVVTKETVDLTKKLNSVHTHTDYNSSCRNLNNSADSKKTENSTQSENQQEIEVGYGLKAPLFW